MVRSKSKHPTRLSVDGETQVLGRIASCKEEEGGVDLLLAAQCYLEEYGDPSDENDDVEDPIPTERLNRSTENRCQPQDEEEEEEAVDSKLPSRKKTTSTRKCLRFALDEVEDNEVPALETPPRQRKRRRPHFPVSFLSANEDILERPPEISIPATQQQQTDQLNSAITLYYQRNLQPLFDSNVLYKIGTIPLSVSPDSSVKSRGPNDEEYDAQSRTFVHSAKFVLVAGQSILALSQFFPQKPNNPYSGLLDSACDSPIINIACCLEKDWMVAELLRHELTGIWSLVLFLTPKPLEICHATAVPLITRSQYKVQDARWIHDAILEVCHLAHTKLPFPQTYHNDGIITAKNVYDWTDNAQIQLSLQRNETSSRNIPGLIPTLRPYQAAAVQWMTQREKKNATLDEWKLAWIVLPNFVSLLHWDELEQHSQNSCPIFFSPKIGWLAKSVQEARQMSIGNTDNYPNHVVLKGGILAESMGLGKTVEVLACILANPCPPDNATTTATNERHTPTTRRHIVFDNSQSSNSLSNLDIADEQQESLQSWLVTKSGTSNLEGETESGDLKDDSSSKDESTTLMGDVGSIQSQTRMPAAVVTPEPKRSAKRSMIRSPEKQYRLLNDWDDTILGSCLCGRTVDLDETDRKTIVLCSQCQEPMHLECSDFENELDLIRFAHPITYRRKKRSWKCYETGSLRHCPCCLAASDESSIVQSPATLIVTPPAILSQWEWEIKRHSRNPVTGEALKVAIYKGVEKTSKSRQDMSNLHPYHLARNDIVLMSFDALMSDFGHSLGENKFLGSQDNGNLRKRKRYRVVPSPLSVIKWWRVCLDEAQRVERPTGTSARMALKLDAHFRWCITGTPVGRGKLEDLYGLILFLQLEPFSYHPFWNKTLDPSHPDIATRIQALLANVFWRSTKANPMVRQQMGVPEQEEKKIFLRFSSIEKHFYQQQLEMTLATAGGLSEVGQDGKRNNKARQLNMLADQLHRLRAACCHPQVGAGGIMSRKSNKRNAGSLGPEPGVGSRVMSMEEILVRLIDDCRLKCEECQRLAGLHTNGMAALSRLLVEAKGREDELPQGCQRSDIDLLATSCRLYLESLELAKANSRPTPVLAKAILTGSTGFRDPLGIMKGGKTTLNWKLDAADQHVWLKIDFEGPARRIAQLKLRTLNRIPENLLSDVSSDFEWEILSPKTCSFEVSCLAVGGEYIPVAQFKFAQNSEEWVQQDGFRTNKSKSWRVVVESCHKRSSSRCPSAYYLGLEFEMDEADIASDPLQKLHILHNASLSFSSLIQLRQANEIDTSDDSFLSVESMKKQVLQMTSDADHIESLYMQSARTSHKACLQRLIQSSEAREKAENSLRQLLPSFGRNRDCWDAEWWDEFLVSCHLYADEREGHAVSVRVQEELEHLQRKSAESGLIKFPRFRDVNGLQAALKSRIMAIRSDGIGKAMTWMKANTAATIEEGAYEIRTDRFRCTRGMHASCMKDVASLSSTPSTQELYENSHCHVCKADWNQRGPKCGHCGLGDRLMDLDPDRVTLAVLNSLHNVLRGPIGSAVMAKVRDKTGEAPDWVECAKAFFDVLEAQKREKVFAWRYWRTHLDLLNDLDELNQCKETMRLSYEGEDLTSLTKEQLNAVVMPCDVMTRYHDHNAKQAMALGDLRRSKETLRFLRNQSVDTEKTAGTTETCAVCLNPFEVDRAVLSCGHSFHSSPCLEKLTSRSGMIACPMRCRVHTRVEEVMLATDKRRDDGSHNTRKVAGSWGTKVTRVVADLLDVQDLGEKAVLFSQWEDMLDIVAEALKANDVSFVRTNSRAKIGDALKTFRSQNCTAVMLNVKNGAEGLTILEATHVMMLEPLLNNALDSQAINRVSRIGQTRKTLVHRYLVEGTVEIKIDALRMECPQEDVIEDTKAAKHAICAGGVDGGFSSEDDLMKLLTLEETERQKVQ